MLVLSRKLGERIVIGDNITVVISRVAGNRVTLGIEAPAGVRVLRGELQSDLTESAPTARLAPTFGQPPDAATVSLPQLAK